MGPTTKAITVTGGVTFPQLVESLLRASQGPGGGRRRHPAGRNLPGHAQRQGRAAGDRTAARASSAGPFPPWSRAPSSPWAPCSRARPPTRSAPRVAHADLLSIGLNCATGPEFMTDHIRTISEMVPVRVSCYPNAGLPNEEGKYLETPDIARGAARAVHRERLAQHRGRLLRHHRRAHPRHRADGRGQAPAARCPRARTARIIRASSWWRPKRATGR